MTAAFDLSNLPYRPCAGIALANTDGLLFVGQRLDNPDSNAWQMPQGGIDAGEDPEAAALRELYEETGVTADKVTILARSAEEYFYDLPEDLIGKLWGGQWRGQRQWWFLMRFQGQDSDIDITLPPAEFSRWKWTAPETLPQMIVPFKKSLYERVLAEFTSLI